MQVPPDYPRLGLLTARAAQNRDISSQSCPEGGMSEHKTNLPGSWQKAGDV